ncbi:MAG: FHA domain-containing protein [Deltaproteobacteria bacterium]|nr:FHA domain-containing protein [Deltaproteobacteria bacterium]
MEPQPTAVLFVDVCGSTAYFERHGEAAGHAMVRRCFSVIVPEIERHRGRIVKTLGDGVLAVFSGAADLVDGAIAAHAALETANEGWPEAERIRVHSGGDLGPVTFDASGDVFGDAVNVAARVQGIAGRDQIYVTADVVAQLPLAELSRTRPIGRFALRGKQEEAELHEVQWRIGSSTVLVSRSSVQQEVRLSLSHEGRVIELAPDKSRLTIGRVESNDLMIPDPAVSREHAEVARRQAEIYLIDHSTNGTYLTPGDGRPHHLHHAEFPLEGSGTFCLGRTGGPAIGYRVTVQFRAA